MNILQLRAEIEDLLDYELGTYTLPNGETTQAISVRAEGSNLPSRTQVDGLEVVIIRDPELQVIPQYSEAESLRRWTVLLVAWNSYVDIGAAADKLVYTFSGSTADPVPVPRGTGPLHQTRITIVSPSVPMSSLPPIVRGQISRMSTATIPIAAAGSYVSTGTTGTLDATTASGIALGTTDAFAVRNITGSTRLLHIQTSIDVHAGNNRTLGIKLALNGTPIDATEGRAFVGASAADVRLAADWIVSVPNAGEVAVFVANHTEAAAIDFRRGRIVATEVR